ncbi:MAG TPA: gliding motility protein GldN [Bacteroidia bacterium]
MERIKNVFLLAAFFIAICGNAQVFTPGDFNDGVYTKENSEYRKPIPYTSLREGDVQWSKRVWRRVDMREKINQPLYYPIEPTVNRTSLVQLLLKYVFTEDPGSKIIAFEDDEFRKPLDVEKFKGRMVIKEDSTDQDLVDSLGNTYTVKVAGMVDSTWIYENFASIDIKEDWFFDKQKSVMERRIIGIGINATLKGKEEFGAQNQFWVYFPQCRPIFASTEVFNTKNDAERRTFDDIFWKQQYSSNIIRETNVYDREIESYAKGIDALLENEKVKNDIFKYEHDMWHF